MDISSKCIHGSRDYTNKTGAVSVPIYQSATFAHPAVGESTGYDYSRVQNPTREQLEKLIAALEKGNDALAFSTGMAALSVLMELFQPGDHIIASNDLYGGSHRLFRSISQKNGLSFDCINITPNTILEYIHEKTKAVFIETPTNPMMQITDIAAVAEITRSRGILLIVDNTFLTPYYQNPLLLGADIVVHSGTKFLSGHNDTLAGFLVTGSRELSEKLRFIYKTTGACLSPFDSWLVIRGIKTLAVRMEKQQENAIKTAHWLQIHQKVRAVYYTGLTEHPGYDINKKQSRGFGFHDILSSGQRRNRKAGIGTR